MCHLLEDRKRLTEIKIGCRMDIFVLCGNCRLCFLNVTVPKSYTVYSLVKILLTDVNLNILFWSWDSSVSRKTQQARTQILFPGTDVSHVYHAHMLSENGFGVHTTCWRLIAWSRNISFVPPPFPILDTVCSVYHKSRIDFFVLLFPYKESISRRYKRRYKYFGRVSWVMICAKKRQEED